MIDWAHDWTDEQIKALEERFGGAYRRAAKELRETTASLMKRYAAEIAKLSRGGHVPTEDELSGLLGRNIGQMSRLANVLTKTATNANEVAFNVINDALPGIYAENANWAAYQVDKGIGMNTGFELVDESTVRRLMLAEDNDQVIHEFTDNVVRPDMQTLRVNLDAVKDVRWNRQKFTASITQSILQGESIPHMAERLERVLNMDKNMATRAARTAATSAENAGRVDSFKRAKRIGIDLEQEWMAAIDGRTRTSHRELDGQHVPVGKKFYAKSTGHEIEFPGDPKAHPSETYNCRCTLVAWTPEMASENVNRWSRLPEGTTYDDWKAGKHTIDRNRRVIGEGQRRPKSKASSSSAAEGAKFTSKQIDAMSRKELEQYAKDVFTKENMTKGLSEFEARERFDLLIDGNSNTDLKKYLKRRKNAMVRRP